MREKKQKLLPKHIFSKNSENRQFFTQRNYLIFRPKKITFFEQFQPAGAVTLVARTSSTAHTLLNWASVSLRAQLGRGTRRCVNYPQLVTLHREALQSLQRGQGNNTQGRDIVISRRPRRRHFLRVDPCPSRLFPVVDRASWVLLGFTWTFTPIIFFCSPSNPVRVSSCGEFPRGGVAVSVRDSGGAGCGGTQRRWAWLEVCSLRPGVWILISA